MALPNIPPSPMTTTNRVALLIATFTVLASSMKPQLCPPLDLLVRKITMSASPPWLASIEESFRAPFSRCWVASCRKPGKRKLMPVQSQSYWSKTRSQPVASTGRSSPVPAPGAGERL
eukprot:437049-Pyramimonas_sp.AAC.1